MSEIDATQLLAQMRAMQAAAGGGVQAPAPGGADFSEMLGKAIDKVNDIQKEAGALKNAFEVGDPDVDLAQVMIAMQKASLSFQAMTQVRNKLLTAYQEIMQMPV